MTTITGSAVELCAVAARRVDPSATSLEAEGPDAVPRARPGPHLRPLTRSGDPRALAAVWSAAARSPTPPRVRSRSMTARRWSRSTFPPNLNLVLTSSTAMVTARMARSLAAWAQLGIGDGELGLEDRQLTTEDPGHGGGLARHGGDPDELDGGIVRGGYAQSRVLVTDGLPRRRDERPVARRC